MEDRRLPLPPLGRLGSVWYPANTSLKVVLLPLGCSETRRLVETAFLASTTALLWLIDTYIPTGVLRVFFVTPTALAYLRWDGRTARMSAGVAALLIGLLLGPLQGFSYLVSTGVLALGLGWLWRRKVPWLLSITLGTVLKTMGFFAQLGLFSLLAGENLWRYTSADVHYILQTMLAGFQVWSPVSSFSVQVVALTLILLDRGLGVGATHVVSWWIFRGLGPAAVVKPRANT